AEGEWAGRRIGRFYVIDENINANDGRSRGGSAYSKIGRRVNSVAVHVQIHSFEPCVGYHSARAVGAGDHDANVQNFGAELFGVGVFVVRAVHARGETWRHSGNDYGDVAGALFLIYLAVVSAGQAEQAKAERKRVFKVHDGKHYGASGSPHGEL